MSELASRIERLRASMEPTLDDQEFLVRVVEEYERALMHYADERRWYYRPYPDDSWGPAKDEGKAARKALAEAERLAGGEG